MKFGTDEVSCYGFFRKRARVTEGATTSSSDQASGGCELAILKLQDSKNKISQQNQEVWALLMEIKKDVTAIKGASLEYLPAVRESTSDIKSVLRSMPQPTGVRADVSTTVMLKPAATTMEEFEEWLTSLVRTVLLFPRLTCMHAEYAMGLSLDVP